MPLAASAQSADAAKTQVAGAPAQTVDLAQGGLVNCFDYYHFGSVQARITPSVLTTVSGTPISFSGQLTNANPYPIVNGTLYVKIFKLRKNAAAKNVNGPYVVDQFVAKDNISIPASGNIPLTFDWNVPSYAQSGEYQVAAFFTTDHKYNLLGLSFTDDVVGNTANFKVAGEQTDGVSFDKDAVTVNDAAYRFAAFPPHVGTTSRATVTATITNTTGKDEVVLLTWTIYTWDAQQEENRLDTSVESVAVAAHGTAQVSYIVTDTTQPVYLVEGTVQYHDTKSIINVRFVRDGIDKLRINFPSPSMFPLSAGKPANIFACFHDAGAGAPDGRLELALYDEFHMKIASYTYIGAIDGNMHGVAKQFTPWRDYDHVTLEAALYQGDKKIDSDTIHYDCDKIDPGSCRFPMLMIEIITGLIVLLATFLIAVILMKWRTHTHNNSIS